MNLKDITPKELDAFAGLFEAVEGFFFADDSLTCEAGDHHPDPTFDPIYQAYIACMDTHEEACSERIRAKARQRRLDEAYLGHRDKITRERRAARCAG